MRLISFPIILTIVLTLVVPMLVQAQGTPQDDKIYDEVRRRLADDADVRGAGLTVTVKNGAVTLEGRVRDERARQKAPRLAKKAKGVTTVENKLKLISET